MKKEQQEFFQLLDEFRKLNMGSMLPGVSHGDACILKAIREASVKKAAAEQGELQGAAKEDESRPIRVADIIEEMKVPPPSVSRGLRGLEERGLIRRNVDEKDRRNTFVEFTAEGKALSDEIETIMAEFADSVFERVGVESFEQLNESMRIFINASREEIKKRKYIEKN